MKYPKLVPPSLCRIPIKVTLYGEGLTDCGEPVNALEASLLCNWQSGAQTVLTKEKKEVRLSGIALFDGDIAPDLPEISSGEAVIFGGKRRVHRGIKARNPDGTVNYTRLELI